MDTYGHSLLAIYGKEGERWLAELPHKIQALQDAWGLSSLTPLSNLSFNYVLKGCQGTSPIILKLSPDTQALEREAQALKAFQGFGAISLLDQKQEALLLEQAEPAAPLKNHVPSEKRIQIVCQIIDQLHQAPLPQNRHIFPTMEEWLKTLDQAWELPHEHLDRARRLKKKLLQTSSAPHVLLHGDLHQENILSHQEGWCVIDPKGVIGSPIHEMWACVEDPQQDLRYLSAYFHYPFQEVAEWYYVHLILAACWQAEDKLDSGRFIQLAQSVLPLIEL